MFYEEFKRKALKHAEGLKWNLPFCEKCKIPMMFIKKRDGMINIKFTKLLKPKQWVGVDE